MATRTRVTSEELLRLRTGDVRRELVNGEVIEMAPTGGVHGGVASRSDHRLVEHVLRHGGGEVVGSEVGFVLSLAADPDRVRAPHVAFVSTTRLARSATVYRADGSARLVREPETLDGEDVLPGLAVPLADVLP